MSDYTFRRYRQPLINSTVLDVFEEGVHVVQAVACADTPESVLVAFSRDGGRQWYGYHKSTAVTLDDFQARFEN